MSKLILAVASGLLLCIGWWFTTYAVIAAWLYYGAGKLLVAGAKGGAL